MPVIDDAVRDAVAIESLRAPLEPPAAPGATAPGAAAPEAAAPPVRIRLVFAGLMLALLLAALDQTIVATALPRIVGELNGLSRMSWVVTAYLLASTIGLPVYGRLGDMIGRKPVFQFAIVVFLVGSVLSGLAHSMNELIAYRAIQGIGGGGLMIGVQAIIADVVSPRERGRYMGLIGAVFGLSSVAGPLLGGWFTDGPGWRWCFWVNLPVGMIALLVVSLVLPRRTRRTPGAVGRLDWLGALLLASVGTCLVLATSWGGSQYAWHSPVILGLIGGAVLSLVLFVPAELWAERRGLAPAIPLRLFRDGVFTLSGLIGLVVGVALFGAASYLPSFLQMVDGASATGSGLKMLPLMAGVVVASIGTGQLISRFGRYRIYPILGGAFGTVGMVLLGLLDAHSSYAVQSVAMAVLGLGVGLVLPVLVLAVQNSVAPGDIGAATSANNYMRQIGGSVGAAVFGTVFASRFAHQLAQRGLKPDNSITPELVHHLPASLRDAYVQAFAAAMPRVFLYLAPVLALGFLLGFLMKEKPLVTHAASEDFTAAEPASASVSAVPAQTVTQAATGTPVTGAVLQTDRTGVPRAVLTLVDLDGHQIARTGSGGDGRWALAAPRNGNYVLIAAAPGHQPQAVTVTVGGRPVELDVVLGGTGRLAGAIRSAEGAPVAGASVTLTDPHGEVVASAHADSDGAYAFRDLVSGTYTLTVSARAYRPGALAVDVAPNVETRQDVTLAGSGTLKGTVRTTAGRPVADARVTLLDAAGAVVAASLTGEDGAFRFTDLEPGEYTVIAAGYPPVATALRLEDGHTERDLHLSHRLDD
ncbi:MFS transporter [Streptacidiphilus jiangxiensis]|uniref:alpha-amylase n=1 Tax=Streptacidiphilus jiangxiensis TaxID=235985 RepID=A0A1H7VQQ8_STRJI|nr:MFS transporter [Streptacidiphilus jiangxiensis]SEM11632.1 drug resistance transporter, EmrB/QacA subfamily [Streptacidiphilus jiangxiensis]